jgi:cardiolipin synthase A/B
MRMHTRGVVIDGRIAYTGGFGIADKWLGDGVQKDQWRDTNVRFEGPAAEELQAAFAAGWAEATGELISGEFFFPLPIRAGGTSAGLLHSMPTIGSTAAERFLALSVSGARKTLYISNSYFVPDDDFRQLLLDAVKRGVDVRILTEGPETDVKFTLYAGRARYEQLLVGGVKIYEYQNTVLHSKTLVSDGIFSTIGSMNFDNRSLAFNNETNLAILDARIGAQMDSLFFEDLKHAEVITPEWIEARPLWERFVMGFSNLISRVL